MLPGLPDPDDWGLEEYLTFIRLRRADRRRRNLPYPHVACVHAMRTVARYGEYTAALDPVEAVRARTGTAHGGLSRRRTRT